MSNYRRTVPSGSNLFAFEAAARHKNFTKASYELNITQPAVSRRIREIEEFLDLQLFIRGGAHVDLTDAGAELFAAVSNGLGDISRTIRDLQRRASPMKKVVISASKSFIFHRLMPHIGALLSSLPKLQIVFEDEPRDVDIHLSGADLALLFGVPSDWEDCLLWHVCDEELYPVCSPEYAQTIGGIFSLNEIESYNILGGSSPRYGWSGWFTAMGEQPRQPSRRIIAADYSLIISAALHGEGIAMGTNIIVDEYVRAGKLIRLVTESMSFEKQFFIAASNRQPLPPVTEMVRDWMLQILIGKEAYECEIQKPSTQD